MTDPLSVTASILTLATTGFAVAKSLYNIANEIGSAGEEIRVYSAEVNGTCQVLQNIFFALEGHDALGVVYEQIFLSSIVSVCSRLMEPLHSLSCALKPLMAKFKQSSTKKMSQLGLKLKWVFSTKSKLLLCRALIGSLRGDLHMLLTLLLIRRGPVNGSARHAMLRESLKSSLAARTARASKLASIHDDKTRGQFEALDPLQDTVSLDITHVGSGLGLDQPHNLKPADLVEAEQPPLADSEMIRFELISSPSTSSDDCLDESDLQALDQAITSSLSRIPDLLLADLARESASNSDSIVRLASGILQMPTFNSDTHKTHAFSAQHVSHPATMQKLYLRLDQNTYDLPLYKFRYWHQMDAFLQNLYRPDNTGKGIGTSPARSTLRDAILSRHVYFQTEEGKRIVLPEFWEDIVRPEAGQEVIRLELRIHD